MIYSGSSKFFTPFGFNFNYILFINRSCCFTIALTKLISSRANPRKRTNAMQLRRLTMNSVFLTHVVKPDCTPCLIQFLFLPSLQFCNTSKVSWSCASRPRPRWRPRCARSSRTCKPWPTCYSSSHSLRNHAAINSLALFPSLSLFRSLLPPWPVARLRGRFHPRCDTGFPNGNLASAPLSRTWCCP